MQNTNRSRIVIFAIILATFAAGALVWYLANPSSKTPDVALQDEQPQDSIPSSGQQPDLTIKATPSPVTSEQRISPEPQVAAAVTPSAPSGTAENMLALIAITTIGGAVGLYRFTTA